MGSCHWPLMEMSRRVKDDPQANALLDEFFDACFSSVQPFSWAPVQTATEQGEERIAQALEALNAWLHALEDAHGRDRSGPRYSDRTLDIDIVLFGDLVAEGPGPATAAGTTPVLRVPRDELRHAFVLKPLAQIAPGAVHPLERRTIAELWQAHPDHDVAFDEVAYRKFKRPFRAVCWVGGGRASPVLGTDRTSVSGISASRGHAAALSAAMLR